jgi:hypothetical protein
MNDVHRERARAFAEREIAPSVAARDREARWDGDLFRRMGAAGLFRAGLPLGYGGSDLRARPVHDLLVGFGEGSGDPGLALAWSAHVSGAMLPILRFGSEAQRRRYLPALGRGERIGAFAHREPATEADPIGVRTRAERRGGRFLLRGTKTWVVNGAVADVLVVTAITDPRQTTRAVSAFLVDKDAPGIRVERRLETAGMRTATVAEIAFEDCEVPEESLLGAEGAGLAQTLRLVLRWQRGSALAPWVGLMRALLDRSVAHARERFQLERTLAASQAIRAVLADMKIRYELSLRLAARSAFQLEQGDAAADRDLAVAALYLTESAAQIARQAAEIQGTEGLEAGSLTARLCRDAAALGALGEEPALLRSVIAGSLLGLG